MTENLQAWCKEEGWSQKRASSEQDNQQIKMFSSKKWWWGKCVLASKRQLITSYSSGHRAKTSTIKTETEQNILL